MAAKKTSKRLAPARKGAGRPGRAPGAPASSADARPKKPAPTKKAAPAKNPAPTKKAAPAKKPAPTKKAAPAKKPAPTKKAAPAKKPAPTKKAAPPQRPARGESKLPAPRRPPAPAGTPTRPTPKRHPQPIGGRHRRLSKERAANAIARLQQAEEREKQLQREALVAQKAQRRAAAEQTREKARRAKARQKAKRQQEHLRRKQERAAALAEQRQAEARLRQTREQARAALQAERTRQREEHRLAREAQRTQRVQRQAEARAAGQRQKDRAQVARTIRLAAKEAERAELREARLREHETRQAAKRRDQEALLQERAAQALARERAREVAAQERAAAKKAAAEARLAATQQALEEKEAARLEKARRAQAAATRKEQERELARVLVQTARDQGKRLGAPLHELVLAFVRAIAQRPDVLVLHHQEGPPAELEALLDLAHLTPPSRLLWETSVGPLSFAWTFATDSFSDGPAGELTIASLGIDAEHAATTSEARTRQARTSIADKHSLPHPDEGGEPGSKIAPAPLGLSTAPINRLEEATLQSAAGSTREVDPTLLAATLSTTDASDRRDHFLTFLLSTMTCAFACGAPAAQAETLERLLTESNPPLLPHSAWLGALRDSALSPPHLTSLIDVLKTRARLLAHASLTAEGRRRQALTTVAAQVPRGEAEARVISKMSEGPAVDKAVLQGHLAAHLGFMKAGGAGGTWEAKFLAGMPRLQYRHPKWPDGNLPLGQACVPMENFTGLSLQGVRLASANLAGIRADGVSFAKAALSGSSLIFAHLERANFRGADLTNCDLTRCYLQGADFRGANLTETNFENADLRGANFAGANTTRTMFRGAHVHGIKY